MDNFAIDPRVYQKDIDPAKSDLYLESASSANATTFIYTNGTFYAEFKSHYDYLDFSRALQARNLPF